jgi:hypothetical protein
VILLSTWVYGEVDVYYINSKVAQLSTLANGQPRGILEPTPNRALGGKMRYFVYVAPDRSGALQTSFFGASMLASHWQT